jgi:hypothetical protein
LYLRKPSLQLLKLFDRWRSGDEWPQLAFGPPGATHGVGEQQCFQERGGQTQEAQDLADARPRHADLFRDLRVVSGAAIPNRLFDLVRQDDGPNRGCDGAMPMRSLSTTSLRRLQAGNGELDWPDRLSPAFRVTGSGAVCLALPADAHLWSLSRFVNARVSFLVLPGPACHCLLRQRQGHSLRPAIVFDALEDEPDQAGLLQRRQVVPVASVLSQK